MLALNISEEGGTFPTEKSRLIKKQVLDSIVNWSIIVPVLKYRFATIPNNYLIIRDH